MFAAAESEAMGKIKFRRGRLFMERQFLVHDLKARCDSKHGSRSGSNPLLWPDRRNAAAPLACEISCLGARWKINGQQRANAIRIFGYGPGSSLSLLKALDPQASRRTHNPAAPAPGRGASRQRPRTHRAIAVDPPGDRAGESPSWKRSWRAQSKSGARSFAARRNG